MKVPDIRIGIGYDLHKLVKGRKLFLGGVCIPFPMGLSGHSDADVILHAICDALLGACGYGDIGMHFPDTDPRFKDASSSSFLKAVYSIVQGDAEVSIINMDIIVICDKPNISRYREKILCSIAGILNLSRDRINLKAKTTEKTSANTISSYAAVLVQRHA
jgi:2-C-methyl-D-erythritol 2,4-cyclodiphosphate synthase